MADPREEPIKKSRFSGIFCPPHTLCTSANVYPQVLYRMIKAKYGLDLRLGPKSQELGIDCTLLINEYHRIFELENPSMTMIISDKPDCREYLNPWYCSQMDYHEIYKELHQLALEHVENLIKREEPGFPLSANFTIDSCDVLILYMDRDSTSYDETDEDYIQYLVLWSAVVDRCPVQNKIQVFVIRATWYSCCLSSSWDGPFLKIDPTEISIVDAIRRHGNVPDLLCSTFDPEFIASSIQP